MILLSLTIGNKVTLRNVEHIRSKNFSLQISAEINMVQRRCSSDLTVSLKRICCMAVQLSGDTTF